MFQSKTLARLLSGFVAAVALVAVLAPMASAKEPGPGYTQFTGCPSPEEKAEVVACQRTVITGGHFQMGSKDVPIEKSMTLVGGWDPTFTNFSFNSKGGLSAAKQKVPGGVIGLTGLTWLLEFLGSEALTLYAQTELAGTNPVVGGDGTNLSIKVHLINSVLGSKCYVGSDSSPIKLHLITGETTPPPPNKPIFGKNPEFSVDGLGIIHGDNAEFVDNAFAAPGANGCTLTLFGFIPISINGLVNSQSGLPSPAGTNETRQKNNTEIGFSSLVFK